MKIFFKWVAPLLVLIIVISSVFLMRSLKPEIKKNSDPFQVAAVRVAPAELDNMKITVKTQGEVRSPNDVQIAPEVTGRIVSINPVFAEGGYFTPETVLAKIDGRQYELAVIRAEARVAEAAVTLDQQQADAEIKEKQWKDYAPGGKPTALALNKPQVAEAQAKLRSAQADLEEAKLNLQRTEIRLPFEGLVVSRDVGLGQYVTAGTVLGRAFGTKVAEVRLPLTDQQLGELGLFVGFNATTDNLTLPVTLTGNMGGKRQHWQGRIVRTQAIIDSETRLYYAIAEIQAPYDPATGTSKLPVGLFVTAEIESANQLEAIVIPRLALRGEKTIYTVDADNTLQIRDVAIYSTNSEKVILSGGLNAGDLVVISPVRSASNGMKIRILPDPALTEENMQASHVPASHVSAISDAQSAQTVQ